MDCDEVHSNRFDSILKQVKLLGTEKQERMTESSSQCPLCGAMGSRPSWLGCTRFLGREFFYVQCLDCQSLYCDPMPDQDTLATMYGTHYATSFANDSDIMDPKEPQRVIDWLARLSPGVFLDFGCGAGALLAEAQMVGWQAVGVEFDSGVVQEVEQRTEARVFAYKELSSLDAAQADVVHLGDVLEHLTELDQQMPAILRLLKPGWLLIAQGPLENNGHLFLWTLRGFRRFAAKSPADKPPYHVMLATSRGQLALFRRFHLRLLEYRLHEVCWPAPARLSLASLKSPRAVALFVLRRSSQSLSFLRPKHWGNRYFYVGQRMVD